MVDEETRSRRAEDLVQEKETELATEELRVGGARAADATIAAQNQAQVAMVKKFNDVIRKLGGATPPDVVERRRGGRCCGCRIHNFPLQRATATVNATKGKAAAGSDRGRRLSADGHI